MSTFDLSLVIPKKEGEVEASKEYQKETSIETGDVRDRKVTDSGMTIDKGKAPAVKLGGPLGYKYTEMLNSQLSLESMGDAAAASSSVVESENESPDEGKLQIDAQGASIVRGGPEGYIYVTDASTVDPEASMAISEEMIQRRVKDPEAKLGVAIMVDKDTLVGDKTAVNLESFTRMMEGANIGVTFSAKGLFLMVESMNGGK